MGGRSCCCMWGRNSALIHCLPLPLRDCSLLHFNNLEAESVNTQPACSLQELSPVSRRHSVQCHNLGHRFHLHQQHPHFPTIAHPGTLYVRCVEGVTVYHQPETTCIHSPGCPRGHLCWHPRQLGTAIRTCCPIHDYCRTASAARGQLHNPAVLHSTHPHR